MPYINPIDRPKFDNILQQLPELQTKGELEYCIYYLMKRYMLGKEFRYSILHDCTYAAQHCADEFRRNYLDKREDQAKDKNGDV